MKKIFYPLASLLCLLFFSPGLFAQVNYTIGAGTSSNDYDTYPTPFPDYYEGSRQQFLFLASEMTTAGMSAGTITSIKWNVVNINLSDVHEEYTIKIGSSALTTLTTTGWATGMSTVYGPVNYTPTTGVNSFLLSAPFYWNGTDNIIIEVCHGDPTSTSWLVNSYSENASVEYTTVTGFNASRTYRNDDLGNLCPYTGTSVSGQNESRRPNTTFTLVAGPPPSCAQPTGLSATNISGTGADLGWTAVTGATGYEYAVTTSATPPATGTPITATTTPSGTLSSSTMYYLHVRTNCGVNGYSFWSSFSFNTLLANDNAVNATLLTVGTACSGTPNGTLVGATVQSNEPAISCELTAGAFNTVWYKFVAPASGMVRISTDHTITGGMDDTKLGIYSVTNPADFNTYQIVGCDEDNGVLGSGYNSLVYLTTLTPSATYYIKVDKYDGSTASGPFCIDVMPITPAMLASTPNCTGTEYENYNPNGGTAWTSLVDDVTGALVANLKANGNNVDDVLTTFHQNTGTVRTYNSQPYLDRNYAIEVDVAPTSAVDVQLFFTDADFNALAAAVPGLTMANLHVTRLASALCASAYNPASQTVSYLPQTGNGSSGGVRYVQFQTPGFSGFFVHAGANPLAIDLENITAMNVGEQNRIDWTTATETKGDLFEVERSIDGEHFTAIGTMGAKGYGSEYTYWDRQPANGINYYRLKVVGAAGDFSYSSIVRAAVDAKDRFILEAYPNPVRDVVTIKTFGLGEAAAGSVILTDITGKPVRQMKMTGPQAELNISDLAPGIYFLKYMDGVHDQMIRISKQ